MADIEALELTAKLYNCLAENPATYPISSCMLAERQLNSEWKALDQAREAFYQAEETLDQALAAYKQALAAYKQSQTALNQIETALSGLRKVGTSR